MHFPGPKLLITSLFHCLIGGCGWYHYTALNPLESFIRDFANQSILHNYNSTITDAHSAIIWSSITTIFLIGGVGGSVTLSLLMDKLGRRFTILVIKNVALIVACFMHLFARYWLSIELFFVARFLAGFASSPNMFLPVFMAECAPVAHRGLCSAICALGLQLWGVLGTVAGLPRLFGTEELWHFALFLPAFPAFIHLLFTPLLAESPKFLYMVKQDKKACLQAIDFYHGTDSDLECILGEYDNEIAMGSEEAVSVGLGQTLSSAHLRWPFILCVVVGCSIAADGSDIAYQYSTGIMMQLFSMENSVLFTVCFVQFPSFLAAALGMALVEICGRKKLFLTGLGICAIGTSFLFISGLIQHKSAMAFNVLGLFMILVGDSVGPSIVRTFLAGELCPMASRSLTAGAMFIAEDLSSTLASFYYPPANHAIGSWAMLPFIILCTSIFVFLYCFLPETKNRTVDDVVSQWVEIQPVLEMQSRTTSFGTLE